MYVQGSSERNSSYFLIVVLDVCCYHINYASTCHVLFVILSSKQLGLIISVLYPIWYLSLVVKQHRVRRFAQFKKIYNAINTGYVLTVVT